MCNNNVIFLITFKVGTSYFLTANIAPYRLGEYYLCQSLKIIKLILDSISNHNYNII